MEGVHLVHIEMRDMRSSAGKLGHSKASSTSKMFPRVQKEGGGAGEEGVGVRPLAPNVLKVLWSRGATAAQDDFVPRTSPHRSSQGQEGASGKPRMREIREDLEEKELYWKSSQFEYKDVRKSNTLLMQRLLDNRQSDLQGSRSRAEIYQDDRRDSFAVVKDSADRKQNSNFLSVSFSSPAGGQNANLSPMSEVYSRCSADVRGRISLSGRGASSAITSPERYFPARSHTLPRRLATRGLVQNEDLAVQEGVETEEAYLKQMDMLSRSMVRSADDVSLPRKSIAVEASTGGATWANSKKPLPRFAARGRRGGWGEESGGSENRCRAWSSIHAGLRLVPGFEEEGQQQGVRAVCERRAVVDEQ
eukprot:768501-Hanusia_phi.AAC.1